MIGSLIKIALTVSVAYVIYLFMLFSMQQRLMYLPNKERPSLDQAPEGTQIIEVLTEDGLSLNAWWTAPKGADSDQPVILLFHGNAGNIATRVDKSKPWRKSGYGVLLAEYRGYGGNPGCPDEAGLKADALAYMRWLTQEAGVDPSRIFIYGESIGSSPAIHAALAFPDIRGIVLEVPLDSVLALAKHHYPLVLGMDWILKDHHRNDLAIPKMRVPVLIGLAGQDEVVPTRFGKRLFNLANQPKTLTLYPDARHNNLHDYGFRKDVLTFIESLQPDPSPSPTP